MHELKDVGPATVAKLAEEGAMVVDIREANEFAGGRIPGSTNVPLSTLASADLGLDEGQAVVFLCASGRRTATFAEQLAAKAGNANGYILEGGIGAWARAGYPVDRAAAGEASGARGSFFGRLFNR